MKCDLIGGLIFFENNYDLWWISGFLFWMLFVLFILLCIILVQSQRLLICYKSIFL